MSSDRPPMSVIVVTRDRPAMLERALAALQASLGATDELIVVDSSSAEAAAVCAAGRRHDARVIRCDRPGETVARNVGWRAAQHDVIAYTDDDMWVDAGWASALAGCLAAYPEAMFVTGRIGIPAGQGTLAVSIKDDSLPEVFDRRSAGLIGHAASLAVRRSLLVELDGFDEQLGAGARFHAAPDVDLFDRAFARGYIGRYEPQARAWHDQWRRTRDYVRLQHRYGIGSGVRLSKLARTDRVRLRVALVSDVWRWGVIQLPGELVRRDWFRALGTLLRLAGMARGFAVGATVPLRHGHLELRQPGRCSSSSS